MWRFGNSAPSFGATRFNTAAPTGTFPKFNPPTGTDTIRVRFHCITCMNEYENKSLEELRSEYYTANRQGGDSTSFMGTGALSQQTSVLGDAGASTFVFSFGGNQSRSFIASFGSGISFGIPTQTQNSGICGVRPNTTAAPVFNFIFGENNQQKELRVEDYGANRQVESTPLVGGYRFPTQQTSVSGTPSIFTPVFPFGGNQSNPFWNLTSTKNSFGSGNVTQNNAAYAAPARYGSPAVSTNSIFKFGTTSNVGRNIHNQKLNTQNYVANRQRGSTPDVGGIGYTKQKASIFGGPAIFTPVFSFGGNQSKPCFRFASTNNTCGSVNYFRTLAQTMNPGPSGELPVFGTSVTSTTPVYNFNGIPLSELKDQPKELRVEHSATNLKMDSTTGVIETDAATQQIGVLCAPSESNSTFPLRGNQSKPLFGISGIKRSETTGNNEERALVALVNVPVDADQQSSKLT